jgi:putative MATE family efflux protein
MPQQHTRTPEETYRRMTQDPVSRLIAHLAVPTIISMLVTSFYNIADTVFVSQLGTQASGAVGIVFSLMSIIQAIGFTFGLGSGNYVSRLLGSRDRETADAVFSTAFFTAFGAGLLLTIFGLSFLDSFMRMLGSTPTILPFARDYGGVILFGAPFMAASFVMNNNLRAEGNATLGMRGIVAGAILNVTLDPLLIFGLGMGIRGAAVATVISQLVSFCILLSYFLRGKSGLKLSLKRSRFRWWLYKEVLRTGMPAFYRQGMASIAIIFLNLFSAPFGDSALAAMTIVTRLMQFLGSALIGFGQGFQPVAGFNWGARYIGRLRQAYWFCIRTGFVTFLIIGSLGFAFAPAIMRLFIRDDLRVVDIGSLALRLQCLVMPLQSINIITAMLFQSVGKGKQASITALSRQGLFFVPLIATLPPLMGVLGLQISQPLADIGTFFLSFLLARSFLKTLHALPQTPVEEVSSVDAISHTML